MAILKSRPRIELRVPPLIFPGDEFVADIVFDCEKEVEAEFVDVSLIGTESAIIPKSSAASWVDLEVVRQDQRRVLDLAPGRTTLPVRFHLPLGAPPTYAGKNVRCAYAIHVRVSIDWWPDPRETFRVKVGVGAVAGSGRHSVDMQAGSYTTASQSTGGSGPVIELSVASHSCEIGQALTGSVALLDAGRGALEEVTLSLVGRETVYGSSGQPRWLSEGRRYTHLVPADAVQDGQAVPFSLPLAEDMAATRQGELWALHWTLEAFARCSAKVVSMVVPITVLPAGFGLLSPQSVAPSVGSERVRAAWSKVATETGMSLDPDRLLLTDRLAGVEVSVMRRHEAGETRLEGTLTYPNLGIGIEGAPASGLRRAVGGGISLGVPAWDRRHFIRGREDAQGEPFIRALQPPLSDFDLLALNDLSVVLEQPVSGLDDLTLRRFAVKLQHLARAIATAANQIRPPESMRLAVAAWRDGAKELLASLRLGDMSMDGSHQGAPASVVTEWDDSGKAVQTRVTVETPFEIDDEYRITAAGGQFDPSLRERFGVEARAVLDRIAGSSDFVSIGPTTLSVGLPAPLSDPEPALEQVRRLVALAGLLRARSGPYR